MRAAVYCRVSSELQRETGSIESQVDYARQYCRLQKIAILEMYLDDGVSGTIKVSERPAGARMLADARARKFDTILVFKIDRLARRTSDLLNTLELLEESGVAIRSMTEPFDTSSAAGKFMTSMLGGIAELERANIAERSRAGMERLAREGRWLGGRAPFGYRVSEGRLAIDLEQGAVVKDIFAWYLSGMRVRAIAARLNNLQIRHPMDWTKTMSRPWYEATVSKLLHNPVYIGEWSWRKRTDRKKVHGRTVCTKTTPDKQITISVPTLVSREDFERVQQTMKENFTFAHRNARYPYLLRMLITCGDCGRHYIGLGSGRPRWYKHYYRCSSHVGAVGRVPCAGKAVRADRLDNIIWEQCLGFINNPGIVLDELREAMSSQQHNQGDIKSEVGQMESALSVKAKERARVINLIRRGVITENEGDRELAQLQSEILQLERQRDALQFRLTAAEHREMRVLTAEGMLSLLADKAANADFETRREIVCAFVSAITLRTIDGKPTADVSYVFQPADSVSSGGVNYSEYGDAISSARLAEI